MMKKLLCAVAALWLVLPAVNAQKPPAAAAAGDSPATTLAGQQAQAAQQPSSALDAQLFYQVLIGEISASDGQPAPAVSLLLDAAKKTNDAQLYQRATDLALQSRAGEAALAAARAWKQAQPVSIEASRYILQILLALNRVPESAEALKSLLELTPALARPQTLAAVPRLYARASDKKLAATVVEQALATSFTTPATAAPAWAMTARMRLAAGEPATALEAARRGHAADAQAEGPALVALELMDASRPQAEALVRRYLAQSKALPELRMAFARNLLEAQRSPEALSELHILVQDKPDYAPGWLFLGSIELQDNQLLPAETSLKRYARLIELQAAGDERANGLAQAFLALSEIAEKRKDYALAETYLNRIDSTAALMQAQSRRASLLARQGKLQEGIALLRALPESQGAEPRSKLLAEVSLLKEFKQYQSAYDLIGRAVVSFPQDPDLLYEQAMSAEKLNKLADMERLLLSAIEIKPDFYAAYNALGYSLADRNLRLPEARELIRKALEFVPADPFIQDSLGWVEFRLGNRAEALRILQSAYKAKPDAEIAAHLGEVLWSLGQRDQAMSIWKEGQLLNADNETLLETLKRLRVKL